MAAFFFFFFEERIRYEYLLDLPLGRSLREQVMSG
jgi:hypothetical protein